MSRRPVAVTQPENFGRHQEGALFSVNEGMPITVALEYASTLLSCVDSLAVTIGDGNGQGSEAYAIQYLAEMAKALVDACASGALHAEGSQ
ncbi:MAG: DUF3077 domain-containing protein [Pseudomonas sp.]|uniref:DUF3077 domain-containing protein n=1 Tax=Pseudomonas sp. TaxID=306 RepID=UPI003BB6761B